MKKWIKIIILVITIGLILTIADIVCILNFGKPLFAIKKNNVYKGLFYNTYICDEHSIALIKSKTEKFNCTLSEKKVSKYNVVNIENVSIIIENVTPISANIVIKDTNSEPYVYGQWYAIEKQIDGKWYELTKLTNDFGFNEMGYKPNEKNEVYFETKWDWLYGKLNKGNYRIIKQANEKYISIEFNINN